MENPNSPEITSIPLENFFNIYQPLKNPFNHKAGINGCIIGSMGCEGVQNPLFDKEMEIVKSHLDAVIKPDNTVEGGERERHLWTVQRNNEGWFIHPGYCDPDGSIVIGYIITKIAWNINNLMDTEPRSESDHQTWVPWTLPA